MKKILIIAPHPDDEIIGCGGLIIKRIKQGDDVYVCIATKGIEPLFSKESVDKTRQECINCHSYLGIKKTFFLEFPAAMLEKVDRHIINQKILEIIKEVKPDEVYLPHIGDMQKDHQIISESSMVALRPKYSFAPQKICSYETLSETGWNLPNAQNDFIPNLFVNISNEITKKLDAMKYYESQLSAFPNARSLEAMEALAKFRGALVNKKAAESFMVIREIE